MYLHYFVSKYAKIIYYTKNRNARDKFRCCFTRLVSWSCDSNSICCESCTHNIFFIGSGLKSQFPACVTFIYVHMCAYYNRSTKGVYWILVRAAVLFVHYHPKDCKSPLASRGDGVVGIIYVRAYVYTRIINVCMNIIIIIIW